MLSVIEKNAIFAHYGFVSRLISIRFFLKNQFYVISLSLGIDKIKVFFLTESIYPVKLLITYTDRSSRNLKSLSGVSYYAPRIRKFREILANRRFCFRSVYVVREIMNNKQAFFFSLSFSIPDSVYIS